MLGDLPSGAGARLAVEVAVTGALGASILLSFVSAVRIITGSGALGGLALAVGACILGIAYVLAVFVPMFMADVTKDRPVPDDLACKRLAPIVSWWVSDEAAFERDLERTEPGAATQLAARRAQEIEAWLERFRRLELPERLHDRARDVDATVTELLAAWEAQRFAPTGTSTAAVAGERTKALGRIRALGAACVDEGATEIEP